MSVAVVMTVGTSVCVVSSVDSVDPVEFTDSRTVTIDWV